MDGFTDGSVRKSLRLGIGRVEELNVGATADDFGNDTQIIAVED